MLSNTSKSLDPPNYNVATQADLPTPLTNKKKPRKRVPISCLNCKKRKVKCDKVKPACGGCVKNQVAHSCQYLEPAWVDKNKAKVPLSVDPIKENIAGQPSNDEYKQYKTFSEKTIHTQRKEIENLKRQLSVLREFSPKILVDNEIPNSLFSSPITVLHKLKPADVETSDQVQIKDDKFLSFQIQGPKQNSLDQCIYVYQWVNIIKLDPQLTNLWYKITNLQKVYHLYKINQISANNNAKQKLPRSSTSSPAPRRANNRVNEIDFTSMFSRSSSSFNNGDGNFAPKCPVIECDFNFMADDDQSVFPISRSRTPERKPDFTQKIKPFVKVEDSHAKTYYNVMSDDAKGLLRRLQNLWDAMINLVRGNEKLNYKQLRFLMEFYFSNDQLEGESKALITFYRRELNWVFKKQDDSVVVDLSVFSEKISDEEAYGLLKMKGVYLAMLSLLVEESLDHLRSSVDNGSLSPSTLQFKEFFPSEGIYQGLGYKGNNILFSVQEVLTNLSSSLMRTSKMHHSLAYVVACVCLLNRHIGLYRRQGSTIADIKPEFTAIWALVLSLMTNRKDSGVHIWIDPSLVDFDGSEARKKELKVHLCYLWSDMVRLVNLVVFESVGLVKGKGDLSSTIIEVYGIIQESEASHSHIRYLARLKSEDYGTLTVSFHVNYLIARSFIILNSAISKTGDILVTMSTFQRVINETKIWSNGNGIPKLKFLRFFEAKTMLMYLELFLTYICILQGEEMADEKTIPNSFPGIFNKCVDLNIVLQKFARYDSQYSSSQYILSAITEILSRSVQLIVGLMIRFKASDDPSKLEYTQIPRCAIKIDVSLKEKLISSTENTVSALSKSQLFDKKKIFRLSKLWSFYLTFINSSKMNSMNYAKMHANVPGVKGMFSKGIEKCPVISNEAVKTSENSSGWSTKCPISHITEPITNNLNQNHVFDSKLSEPKTGKCPIDHTVLMNNSEDSKKSKCPIDHPTLSKNLVSEVTSVPAKRKCPFDHESFKKGDMPKGFNESHVRGSSAEPTRGPRPFVPKIEKPTVLPNNTPTPFTSSRSPVHDTPLPTAGNVSDKIAPKPSNKTSALGSAQNSIDSSLSVLPFAAPTPLSETTQAINFNDLTDFDFDFLQNDSWFEQFDMVNGDSSIIEGFFQ